MKKTSLSAIRTALESIDPTAYAELINEIDTELGRDKARKDANAQAYEAIKGIVMDALAEGEATISELYESVKDKLPESMTKAKVQYAITRLWADEVIKTEGNPNTYRKA